MTSNNHGRNYLQYAQISVNNKKLKLREILFGHFSLEIKVLSQARGIRPGGDVLIRIMTMSITEWPSSHPGDEDISNNKYFHTHLNATVGTTIFTLVYGLSRKSRKNAVFMFNLLQSWNSKNSDEYKKVSRCTFKFIFNLNSSVRYMEWSGLMLYMYVWYQ